MLSLTKQGTHKMYQGDNKDACAQIEYFMSIIRFARQERIILFVNWYSDVCIRTMLEWQIGKEVIDTKFNANNPLLVLGDDFANK